MIPGTWLPESDNTGGIPYPGRLPVSFDGVYTEGGNGTLMGQTELDFQQVSLIFIQSFIQETFGYGPHEANYERTLRIILRQQEVFGVLLLDSFTPPAVAGEFFEFPADIQDACQGDTFVGIAPTLSACETGSATDYAEATQTRPTYTEV